MSATSMSTFFNSINAVVLDCYLFMSLDIGEVVDMLDCASRLVMIESDADDDGSFKFLIDLVLANSAGSYVLLSFSPFSFASILFGEITLVTSTFLDSIVIFFSAIVFASSSFRLCALDYSRVLPSISVVYFSSFFTGVNELLIVSDLFIFGLGVDSSTFFFLFFLSSPESDSLDFSLMFSSDISSSCGSSTSFNGLSRS